MMRIFLRTRIETQARIKRRERERREENPGTVSRVERRRIIHHDTLRVLAPDSFIMQAHGSGPEPQSQSWAATNGAYERRNANLG